MRILFIARSQHVFKSPSQKSVRDGVTRFQSYHEAGTITVNTPPPATAYGYSEHHYMTSPALDDADSINWYSGEGEATPAEPFP